MICADRYYTKVRSNNRAIDRDIKEVKLKEFEKNWLQSVNIVCIDISSKNITIFGSCPDFDERIVWGNEIHDAFHATVC